VVALAALSPLPAAAGPVTLACRDREDPSMGATLVLDIERKRLVEALSSGPTILFQDRDLPLTVGAQAVAWTAANNLYRLSRVTLELDVAGRIYVCERAQRQF
jgi:hypothetical protein